MSSLATGEAFITKPRSLVFDQVSNEEVPAFLRKELIAPSQSTKVEIKESTTSPAVQEHNDDVIELTQPAVPASPVETPAHTEIQTPSKHVTDPGGDSRNLDEMSVEDLQKLQEEIDRRKAEKRQAEKAAVIKQIVEVVNMYKIPIDELVEALGGLKIKRKGVKASPKYRDPVSGAIWTGRGKEPLWIRGKNRDKFLIK